MSITALDLITDSLVETGVLAAGEVPTAEDADLCRRRLNALLDSLNVDRGAIFKLDIDEYTLIPGHQPHTIGIDPEGLVTADFAHARPARIERAFIKTGSGSSAVRDEIWVWTEQEWSRIAEQAASGSQPVGVYPDYAAPVCNLYFWPVPEAAVVYEQHAWTTFEEFSAVSDVVKVPAGYYDLLMYNLALRIAPAFGRTPSAVTVEMASRARTNLQSLNSRALRMDLEVPAGAGSGRYSIFTDQ